MKLVVLSDTHLCQHSLDMPEGDMLVFAGDLCGYGRGKEAEVFAEWLDSMPYKYKIVVAGNHDWPFFKDRGYGHRLFDGIATYLQDEFVEVGGIRFYGSPWQPEFCDWAFNLPRGEKLKEKWDKIPNDVDILVTHAPPAGILDQVDGMPMGCSDLYNRVLEVQPKYHIFGHIHTARGVVRRNNIIYVNASIVDDYNAKQNDPIVIDYESGKVVE